MNKEKSNKKKSIVILTIFSVLIILGAVFAFVDFPNGELGIRDYIAYPKTISLGLDLSGGAYAVYSVDPDCVCATDDDGNDVTWSQLTDAGKKKSLLEGTRARLSNMLADQNYPEALVEIFDEDKIRVEVPNVDNPERIFELIGKPADLEFKAHDSQDTSSAGTSFSPAITGKDVEDAGVTWDSEKNSYAVALRFTTQGAKKFSDATSQQAGKYIGIYIDDKCVIAPSVDKAITGGSASITGGYTYDQAEALAVQILAGSFDLSLTVSESNTLTAQLGEDAIRAGVIAGLVGLALIIVYLVVLYRLLGVAAGLALVYYTMTYVFFLAIIPNVQLTLAGIAGVLLSIGMAVDANVIIFERIKEEYALGKKLRTAISTGFRRSYGAILDGNITTIMGAIVLMIVGAASISGFGTTLLIGIILSLISSLLITHLLLICFMQFSKESDAAKYGLKRKDETESDDVADGAPEFVEGAAVEEGKA